MKRELPTAQPTAPPIAAPAAIRLKQLSLAILRELFCVFSTTD